MVSACYDSLKVHRPIKSKLCTTRNTCMLWHDISANKAHSKQQVGYRRNSYLLTLAPGVVLDITGVKHIQNNLNRHIAVRYYCGKIIKLFLNNKIFQPVFSHHTPFCAIFYHKNTTLKHFYIKLCLMR